MCFLFVFFFLRNWPEGGQFRTSAKGCNAVDMEDSM